MCLHELSHREVAILNRLLEVDFPGADGLRRQVPFARAWAHPEPDDVTVVLDVDRALAAPAATERRVPVEASARDSDGAEILILLHVIDGYLDELEFIRGDGKPMLAAPKAEAISVRVASPSDDADQS